MTAQGTAGVAAAETAAVAAITAAATAGAGAPVDSEEGAMTTVATSAGGASPAAGMLRNDHHIFRQNSSNGDDKPIPGLGLGRVITAATFPATAAATAETAETAAQGTYNNPRAGGSGLQREGKSKTK